MSELKKLGQRAIDASRGKTIGSNPHQKRGRALKRNNRIVQNDPLFREIMRK